MNVTNKQWLAFAGVFLSVLIGSTAQLTDIFGPAHAKAIISLASMANGLVNGAIAIFASQSSIVKETAAMPGVDAITVNTQANQTLAQVAMDPANFKVAPVPGAEPTINDIAKGSL